MLVSLPNSGDTLTLPGSYRACGHGWADVTPLHGQPESQMHNSLIRPRAHPAMGCALGVP